MNRANLHPFDALTPDLIMDAIESQGYLCDGSVFAMNSYENRVYQIGIEDQSQPIIAKFYRPNRWNEAQIQEEHDFCLELLAHDIPVVVPIVNNRGESVFIHEGFIFALYIRKGGYAPELDHKNNLEIMARTLARLHLIGEKKPFRFRPTLNIQTFGRDAVNFVAQEFIPLEYKSQYLTVCHELIELMTPKFSDCHNIRVHGDLHIGNILMREELPYLVDFDDSRMAPAIQDIWMLLSGEENEQKIQLNKIINAYEEFRAFPFNEINMIESLRSLRILHHCAWLARRYDDPAFESAFPWFDEGNYWPGHISDLTNQLTELKIKS